MKKTKETHDLETDDEALREAAIIQTPRRVAGFVMRPITCISFSHIMRMRIFEDEEIDAPTRTAAFAFLHIADKEKIRDVIWNRTQFYNAVEDWVEAHFKGHHTMLEPFSEAMTEAFEIYNASKTRAQHASPATDPTGGK